ncbi:SAM-dependent methyltransferase [Frankia sp. AgB1.9]|uniref:SAM-dependent methyltransferase n=1 Tax=unclassified Frankia TaxID=2632575 RepID=UPI0019347DA0|nr:MULTISPECIES: SAM-dependent methyltransferase [unclassified Frankia]MBL7489724.1 SAM-dependent methyltransferase [Frankia sp. AgW1.1]MBL7551934.1 SAM-dependent methyltransferase [Frankia sp. AgB1.9]MBL7623227.1 SAM-dependent methyltransferase [Frankia sp. AgB1.8]
MTVDLRTDVPHSARMYDWYLDGKDNFPPDRAAGKLVLETFPQARTVARSNRAFLRRAIRFLAAEAGVDQFLDIGTGIPTSPNLHEVAQQITPRARVLYVDNDPIVLAHARALLTSHPEGATAYLDANLLDPGRILDSDEVRDTLDLTRPVGLSLIAVLHFLPDDTDPHGIVATLLDALPPGSYLTITHATADFARAQADQAAKIYRALGIPAQTRSRDEVASFFDGLELVDPGVVVAHRWRPGVGSDVPEQPDGHSEGPLTDADVSCWAAVGAKP